MNEVPAFQWYAQNFWQMFCSWENINFLDLGFETPVHVGRSKMRVKILAAPVVLENVRLQDKRCKNWNHGHGAVLKMSEAVLDPRSAVPMPGSAST